METAEIYSASLTRTQLARLTDDERHFLFLVTHLANEINMVLKACMYTNNSVGDVVLPENIEYKAAVMQFYFWTRMLAGKVYEGWNLLQSRYFSSSLSQKYSKNEDFKKVIDQIKRYFSRGDTLLELIRNNYAHHVADKDKQISVLLDNYPDSHVFVFYDSNYLGGRFYFAAEELIVHSVRNEYMAAHSGTHYSHEELVKEILKVTSLFNQLANIYFNACMEIIFANDEVGARKAIRTEHVTGPNADEVTLPYFSIRISDKAVAKPVS